MTRFRNVCESVTKRGLPCGKPATHVWRGQHCCVWHGDPARSDAARRSIRRRQWTPDNLEKLYYLTERGTPDDVIARRLRTTVAAVQAARFTYGLARRKTITLDAMDVARMFGRSNSQTVRTWIKHGYLPARRAGKVGRQQLWMIEYGDLEAFVRDERYWHLWSPDQVTRTTLLHASGRPRDLTYYSVAQVADICGVSVHAPSRWCAKGWLRSVKHGHAYMVRSDWLDAFRKVWSYGDGIGRNAG